ncbi:hypothetical protein BGW39_011554 [Mortierella sp. 14UC]|nr:hypothetical protein BGW39_011554 [Mortierella sp. 14UC]
MLYDAKATDLTPGSKVFLVNTLSNLPHLRHKEIGQGAENFLLANLAEYFPNVTSFVHSGAAPFDRSILPQPPQLQKALRSLEFVWNEEANVDARELRWIVMAFPALEELTLTVGNKSDSDREMDLSVLQETRIIFHSVKELMRWNEDEEQVFDFTRLLCFFPALERFEFTNQAVFTDPVRDIEEAFGGKFYWFKTMVLGCGAWLFSDEANQVISKAPFLTRVKLHCVFPSTLLALADNCPNLEYAHFNGDYEDSYSLELSQLFDWTCNGLKKLDIMIGDILRVERKQEEMMEKALNKSKMNGGQGFDDLQEKVHQQLLSLDSQPKSRLLQEMVFSRLARLKHLEELDLRNQRMKSRGQIDMDFHMHDGTLDFTLEAGLKELHGLSQLRRIAFSLGVDEFGQKERDWLWERWGMQEEEGERGVFCVQELM